jgi:hypothetical protein
MAATPDRDFVSQAPIGIEGCPYSEPQRMDLKNDILFLLFSPHNRVLMRTRRKDLL